MEIEQLRACFARHPRSLLLWKSVQLKRSAMSDLAAKLMLFVTSPSLMLPSSIQELILFTLCAILSCHVAKRVLSVLKRRQDTLLR